MGIINSLTRRCVFCKKRPKTKYIPNYSLSSEQIFGNWYHPECLNEVCCYPEKYPEKVINLAVAIINRIKKEKKMAEDKVIQDEAFLKRQRKFLKSQCI